MDTPLGENGVGNRSDAFRHAIWNTLMSRDISVEWAEEYATAHEAKSSEELSQVAPDGFSEREHRIMDLFNNEQGRQCWLECDASGITSDDDLVDCVKAKIDSGSLMWLHYY